MHSLLHPTVPVSTDWDAVAKIARCADRDDSHVRKPGPGKSAGRPRLSALLAFQMNTRRALAKS
jgi:hypothetical protein